MINIAPPLESIAPSIEVKINELIGRALRGVFLHLGHDLNARDHTPESLDSLGADCGVRVYRHNTLGGASACIRVADAVVWSLDCSSPAIDTKSNEAVVKFTAWHHPDWRELDG